MKLIEVNSRRMHMVKSLHLDAQMFKVETYRVIE